MERKHKRLAWAESAANVLTGLVSSVLVFQPVVFGIYDIQVPLHQNIQIALWFTAISIVRGYIWRRWFHKKFYVEKEDDFNIVSNYIYNTYEDYAFPEKDSSNQNKN